MAVVGAVEIATEAVKNEVEAGKSQNLELENLGNCNSVLHGLRGGNYCRKVDRKSCANFDPVQ